VTLFTLDEVSWLDSALDCYEQEWGYSWTLAEQELHLTIITKLGRLRDQLEQEGGGA